MSVKRFSDGISLFAEALLSDPGSRGFSVTWQEQLIQGFVVRRDGNLHAYLNSCPHTGAPLDWVDHQFLDLEKRYIQCAVHDARFEIETGYCVVGPCVGRSLQSLPVRLVDDQVVLMLTGEAVIKPAHKADA